MKARAGSIGGAVPWTVSSNREAADMTQSGFQINTASIRHSAGGFRDGGELIGRAAQRIGSVQLPDQAFPEGTQLVASIRAAVERRMAGLSERMDRLRDLADRMDATADDYDRADAAATENLRSVPDPTEPTADPAGDSRIDTTLNPADDR